MFVWLTAVNTVSLAEEGAENKQALATSPGALIEMLESVSFLTPEKYRQKIAEERASHIFPLNLEQLPQKLDEATDPRKGITAGEIAAYSTGDHTRLRQGFVLKKKKKKTDED